MKTAGHHVLRLLTSYPATVAMARCRGDDLLRKHLHFPTAA
jgi:hypothetical protein